MSFSESGVKLHTKRGKNAFAFFLTRAAEAVLSVVFVITLAAPMVFPNQANAALGVSSKLSYQGRLTDVNGNPLTGTYCVRYSIYDNYTGGTKLWPTSPTATSTAVSNGVFNAPIGEMDTLAGYDFSANDTEYLNVEVATYSGTCGTFESLAPRQQLSAVAYARVAADVYGDTLKTDNVNRRVQIGQSEANPVLLLLGVKNTANATLSYVGQSCTVNGTIWYNSASTKALVCENSVVRALANATTTLDAFGIGGNTAGSPATISAGTVSLAGGNNVTLSQNGSVITISAFNQSVQTQNLHNLTISSNTAGVGAAISSGTLTLAGGANITLSQNGGNAITIIGGAGGGGLAGIGASNTTYTSGTVIFSGLANITINSSVNGASQYVQISAPNPGGGGGATVSYYPTFPVALATLSNYTGATAAGTNITASFHVAPLLLEDALSFTRINIVGSYLTTIAGTGSVSIARMLGIYTLNGGTALSLSTSYMFRNEISQSSVTARTVRWYWGTNSTSNSSITQGNVSTPINSLRIEPLWVNAAGSVLSAGQYYVVFAQTNVSAGSNIMPAASIMYISQSQSSLGGQLGSAVTLPVFPLLGQFSSTTVNGNYTSPFMPSSVNTTAITNTGGSSQWKWPYVNFLGK